jgi:hypothetical protein
MLRSAYVTPMLASLLLLGTPARAALTPAASCCAAKVRSVGAHERMLFRCHARAAARGVAVDPACVAAVGDALGHSFARSEADGGCSGTGDAPHVQADLERIVGGLAASIRGGQAKSACAARKLKVTGRLALSAARLFAPFAPKPGAHLVDVDAPSQALLVRLRQLFLTLESMPLGCPTTGDADDVWQTVLTGAPNAGGVPDGLVRDVRMVCDATCGNNLREGAEQCDLNDGTDCDGFCQDDCTCPICGDGLRNRGAEMCDGTDASNCAGVCRPDCTCPTPVCGNDVRELGEECDGTALGSCGICQADCTCAPGACGNGIVEGGEQCDGATCLYQGVSIGCRAPGPNGCSCCSDAYCYGFGCCDEGTACLPAPTTGFCFKIFCDVGAPDCGFGYTCTYFAELVWPYVQATDRSVCAGQPGSICALPDFGAFPFNVFLLPCVAPATCHRGNCCLPAGEVCGGPSQCCSDSCTAGVCD